MRPSGENASPLTTIPAASGCVAMCVRLAAFHSWTSCPPTASVAPFGL